LRPIERPALYDVDGRTRCELPLYDHSDRVVGAARWWEDEVECKLGATRVPVRFEVVVAPAKFAPVVQLTVEIVKQVPRCTEVVVKADGTGTEILAKHLKEIRLNDWIDVAIANVAREVIPIKPGASLRALSRTPKGQRSAKLAISVARRRTKITPEFLAEVADVYRQNFDRPVVAVERAFGVRHRTAANYVDLARKAKLLPETSQGKKKI
jgi:hypothetical protein